MTSTVTLALGAAIVLLATARALAQLLHLRRMSGARVGQTHAAAGSTLAPVAGAMTLIYAYLISGDSALMAATTINTLSAIATAVCARARFLSASHPSASNAAKCAACGEQP